MKKEYVRKVLNDLDGHTEEQGITHEAKRLHESVCKLGWELASFISEHPEDAKKVIDKKTDQGRNLAWDFMNVSQFVYVEEWVNIAEHTTGNLINTVLCIKQDPAPVRQFFMDLTDHAPKGERRKICIKFVESDNMSGFIALEPKEEWDSVQIKTVDSHNHYNYIRNEWNKDIFFVQALRFAELILEKTLQEMMPGRKPTPGILGSVYQWDEIGFAARDNLSQRLPVETIR